MALMRIQGEAHVAEKYGLEEAILLDSIMYWWRENRANGRNYRDGRWWTYNTMHAFAELLPWWSDKQIRRIITSCKDQGAILVGNYNADGRDRTAWYTPSDELLALYGEHCICPNGQMQVPNRAESFDQTGTALPCSYHAATDMDSPPSPPEGGGAPADDEPKTPKSPKSKPAKEPYRLDWFEAFWAKYPRKDNKQQALKAWCRLKPDRATCGQMAAGLERDKRSRQWTKDNGDYIPHASTWINQRRWENEGVDPSQLPTPPDPGGWAPDPEVI